MGGASVTEELMSQQMIDLLQSITIILLGAAIIIHMIGHLS